MINESLLMKIAQGKFTQRFQGYQKNHAMKKFNLLVN